jgi:nuclear transport factor 2 (NTF2) superfamily protein
MISKPALLERVYDAFNARDMDTVLAALHPDVDWPNGWEGGRIAGRDGVRDYWTRQWAAIDPSVTPVSIIANSDGRLMVRVRQLVKDLAGNVTFEGEVEHVYTFEGDLIRRMDIS